MLEKNELEAKQQDRVAQVVKSINPKDTNAVISYGTAAQKSIATFSDQVLRHVRAKDTGHVGEMLSRLLVEVQAFDVDRLTKKKGLSALPIIGALFDQTKKFLAQYQKLSIQIEEIVHKLEGAKVQLMKDITMLNGLYEKNKEFYYELTLYIEAGEIKLKEVVESEIPLLQAKIASTQDNALLAQELKEMTEFVQQFKKKIHDLKLSRQITLQTAPQIKLIQGNNQILAERIQSSILNTIPLWKSQVVIAISLARQKHALELQKDVNQTTNELLQRNSEMLKQGSIEIAKENEKGIVEIDTLKRTHENLLYTLEETIRIQREGSVKRQEVEEELEKMEQELKETLVRIASQT